MHEWLTSETWRSEKELNIDQNSWINKIYEKSMKYEWVACLSKKKANKSSLKHEHRRTNCKEKNHQRTSLEKYAVNQERKFLNSYTCEWILKIF